MAKYGGAEPADGARVAGTMSVLFLRVLAVFGLAATSALAGAGKPLPGVKAGDTIKATDMNCDTAPTVAAIFGLERPEVRRGRPLTEVFGR